MAVIDRARARVLSPTYTPLPYGLLSVASGQTEGAGSHWEAGIEYQPDTCAMAGVTTDNCLVSITKAPTVTGIGARGSNPFTVYAEIQCGPIGSYDEMAARTTTALTNGEGRAIERVFWTGVAGGETIHPHLAHDAQVLDSSGVVPIVLQTAASVLTTGASIDVTEAVGSLEGALSECYGGEGVLHVPRSAVAHLAANGLVYRDGQRLRTFGGNLVAAYTSNDCEGPTGADPAAGQAWFYATGAVDVRRGPISYSSALPEALNRSENTLAYIAERTVVFTWDCCHFATQVTLGGTITGGAGVG